MVQYQDRIDQVGDELHLWPRPLSPGTLRVVKALLGLALVAILLLQLLGTAGIGTLVDNLFAVLFLLSLAGPARRLLQRRAARGQSPDVEPK